MFSDSMRVPHYHKEIAVSDYDLFGNINAAEPSLGAQIGKTVLRTHPEGACSGEYCSIHNPSDHALKDAPLNWRGDRGLMERICEHGVGHPDPDHLAHTERLHGARAAQVESVHGCDFCCVEKEESR